VLSSPRVFRSAQPCCFWHREVRAGHAYPNPTIQTNPWCRASIIANQRAMICRCRSLVAANHLIVCRVWWLDIKAAFGCPGEPLGCIPQGNQNRKALDTYRHDRPEPAEFQLQATCRMDTLTSASCPSQKLLVVRVPCRAVRSYRGPPDEHITSWRVQEQVAIGHGIGGLGEGSAED
jgi:hypothetical protein